MNDQKLASHWEKVLKSEGLSKDVGVDRGAVAFRAHKMEEAGIPLRDIQDEVRLYWLNRDDEVDHDAHVQKAQEIAKRFGVSEEIINGDFLRSIEDEIAEAQRTVESLASELLATTPSLAYRQDAMSRQLMGRMTKGFGVDFSPSVISALVDGYINRQNLQ
jgi:hypothetical protein